MPKEMICMLVLLSCYCYMYYLVTTTLSFFFSNENIEKCIEIVLQEKIHELFYEMYENIYNLSLQYSVN